jgi:NitT/TauT family transport system permease protein
LTLSRVNRSTIVGIAIAISIIAVWWIISTGFSRIVLPSPIEVAGAFWDMGSSGMIPLHVSYTLYRVGISFAIALGLSLALGLLIGRSSATQGFLERVVVLIQSVPAAIWIVVAIIWFGISDLAPIFVITAIAFPILAINIFEGIKNVDRGLVEMGEIFDHGRQSIFADIVLPSIFPHLLSGSRVSLSLGWKVSVIAEVLGAQSGIGYAISYAWERLRTDEIFAWAIVIVLVLQAFDILVFRVLERRIRRYMA